MDREVNMAIVDNLREGFRRLWIINAILITIVYEIWLICLIVSNSESSSEDVPGYILLALSTGIMIYFFLHIIGWSLFLWIFNGFAGIKSDSKQQQGNNVSATENINSN
jgi:hypothetical protein